MLAIQRCDGNVLPIAEDTKVQDALLAQGILSDEKQVVLYLEDAIVAFKEEEDGTISIAAIDVFSCRACEAVVSRPTADMLISLAIYDEQEYPDTVERFFDVFKVRFIP